MTKNTSTLPRPLSPQDIQSTHQCVNRAGWVGAVCAAVLLGLALYGANAEGISRDQQGWLLIGGFGVVVVLFGSFLVAWAGGMATTEAGMDGPRLAWLNVAKSHVPEVAQFVDEVRAQDRGLLRSEYDILMARYQREVYQLAVSAA